MTKHSDAGYIIISAFRDGDIDPDQYKINKKNSKELKDLIKKSGYSFVPIWGGFEETDKQGNKQTVKQRSFIVFNFKKNNKMSDSEELKKLGQEWCKKFNQESFLWKEEGQLGKAHYVDLNGKIEMSFNAVTPTDASDIYFSSLKNSRRNPRKKALTFRESLEKGSKVYNGKLYMSQSPSTLAQAYKRSGELFFRF